MAIKLYSTGELAKTIGVWNTSIEPAAKRLDIKPVRVAVINGRRFMQWDRKAFKAFQEHFAEKDAEPEAPVTAAPEPASVPATTVWPPVTIPSFLASRNQMVRIEAKLDAILKAFEIQVPE